MPSIPRPAVVDRGNILQIRCGQKPSTVVPRIIFCVDFGLETNHSALIVFLMSGDPPARYELNYAQRWPLKVPYQVIANHIKALHDYEPIRDYEKHLVVDRSGVGVPVCEMLVALDLMPVQVVITSGYEVTRTETGVYHVAKRVLVTATQMVIQSDRLGTIDHPDIPWAREFIREASTFKLKISQDGNDQYNAEPGQQDDLVMAGALGLWYGEHCIAPLGFSSTMRPRAKRKQHRSDEYIGEPPRAAVGQTRRNRL
jgi:hypothetical protein